MSEIIIYQSPDGQTQLDVQMDNQTVWLSQAQMAMLFKRDQSVISRHIRNVFVEGELEEKSNMQNLHIQKRLAELGKIVQLIEQSGSTDGLQLGEAKGLLEILGGYTHSFVLLNQYDSHPAP